LIADTRAEHLLLAAQRLGRERVFVLGGLLQVEKDKEKGPKTPKLVQCTLRDGVTEIFSLCIDCH
jgi:hypothetical protein